MRQHMILYALKQDLASSWKVHSGCLHTTVKMIKKGAFVTGKKRRA